LVSKNIRNRTSASSRFSFDSSEFKVSGLKLKVELEKIKNQFPLTSLVIIGNKADKLDEIEIINLRNEIPEIVLISAKEKTRS
jgi:tRNA modification GTPase